MAQPSTSLISPQARIGRNVKIGDFCKIHGNVIIGDDSVIEDYCTLGYPTPLAEGRPLEIGPGALVRSYSCLYEGSRIGRGFRTGHRVTLREKTEIGDEVQVGTLCDIQGDCKLGNYVRLHSNVHISKLSVIKDFVWIFPYVITTNDPRPPSDGYLRGVTVHEYAVVATQSTLLPGVQIGTGALVGAHSRVDKDVPPHMVATGAPAQVLFPTSRLRLPDNSGPAYPWTRHFHRGYPEEVVAQWLQQVEQASQGG